MNIKLIFNLTLALLILNITVINASHAQVKHQDAFISKELINLNSLPKWFNESLAREKKVKKKSKLKNKQFNVNSKVIGKAKLVEEGDGTWYYQINIGTDSPVECFVFSEFDGPANSLYGIVDNSLLSVEELYKKKISAKSNFAIGSGVIGSTPYLLFDTLYILGEEGDKTPGVLKALSAETNESLQICMHNELGYRKTFFSVFESFIQAFTENEADPDFFEFVIQMKLNDIPVGFSKESYSTDDEGDVSLLSESSIIFPVDSSSVARSDSQMTSWSTPDGALLNASEYSVENGVLSSNLSIVYADDKWQVTGLLQGKNVEYDLEYKEWLLSSYGSYIGVESLGKSDQQSVEYKMWLPEADPSTALSVIISKVEDDPNANFKMNLGPMVVQFMAEENGVFREGDFEQGPLKLNFERVFLKGDPVLK